jgi:DNA-binding CsgD family transcriptional regulator
VSTLRGDRTTRYVIGLKHKVETRDGLVVGHCHVGSAPVHLPGIAPRMHSGVSLPKGHGGPVAGGASVTTQHSRSLVPPVTGERPAAPSSSGRPAGLRTLPVMADRWALAGREGECAAIADVLDDDRPRSIVIAGLPGVGRTRLAREALAIAGESGRPTRWATGSEAAALVPLGALAHLLPSVDVGVAPLVLLQRAMGVLGGEESGGAPAILGVDDVHLLDRLSVTLLQQLAVSGAVTLVLTVRVGRGLADPVAPLWKDGLASRLELQPMQRADAERMVAQALGGELETRTGERLWRLTRGRPLYVRELVEDGLHAGQLRRSAGVWRWEGEMAPSERLIEIVLGHMGDVDAAEWRVLEVLAAGDPVRLDRLTAVSTADAVRSLERRGLVTEDTAGSTGEVRAGHPLYAEVVRRRTSRAALQAIRRQLVDSRVPPTSHDDLLRRSAVLMDGEAAAPDPVLLTETAQRANAMLDHPLAERLARAGIEAGAGAEAHLALVEAAYWQGQAARSEQLAAEAASVAVADDQRARLTAARALVLFCGLGRGDDAWAVLRGALAAARSVDDRALLTATQAVVALLGGDPAQALHLANTVLGDPSRGGAAEPLAAAAAGGALALTGHTEAALATVRAGWTAQQSLRRGTELAFTRVALAQAEVMALHLGGRIRELERRTVESHQLNLMGPEWAGDAVACMHRGWGALAVGRPREAIRWLAEALAGLESRDPAGLLPLCSSLLAMARALVGDLEGARAALAPRLPHRAIALFDPVTRLAQAWLASAEGRDGVARALALDAAAAAGDQPAMEAFMLHEALRLGARAEVSPRLADLAQVLELASVTAFAAHADAVGAGDGRRLDLVSLRFEELGDFLLAADTAAEAARAHERAGDKRAAALSTTRAANLAQQCGMADTPARDHLAPPKLTTREAEVAHLAARGLPNQAIATTLVLSVRTVEAHLAHAYVKLGITNRSALPAALEPSAPRRPRLRPDQPRVGRAAFGR